MENKYKHEIFVLNDPSYIHDGKFHVQTYKDGKKYALRGPFLTRWGAKRSTAKWVADMERNGVREILESF